MLRIRLQRVGRRHEPSFRIVLTNSQNSTKSGRIKEILGSYDPRFDNPVINTERVNYWMSVGAKPTDTMHNILVSKKILSGKKINVLPRKSPIKKETADSTKEVRENDSLEKESGTSSPLDKTEVSNSEAEVSEEAVSVKAE